MPIALHANAAPAPRRRAVARAAAACLAAAAAAWPASGFAQLVCPVVSVTCRVLADQTLDVAGTTVSTVGADSPLAFELRGDSYVVNTGTATFIGDGLFITRNPNFGFPNSMRQLRNEAGATLRLRGHDGGTLSLGVTLENRGRIEVLEGRLLSSSVTVQDGTIAVADGARWEMQAGADLIYSGSMAIENAGSVRLAGRLLNTPVTGNVDLGAGRFFFSGTQMSTLGRIASAGTVVFQSSGPQEVQADLDFSGLTLVDLSGPAFAGQNELWLNGSFAPRQARFENLVLERGTLRVGQGQRVEVSGNLVVTDGRIRLDTLVNDGIVMRTEPQGGNAEALLRVENAEVWTGVARLRVERPVRVVGMLPRGVTNASLMSFSEGALPGQTPIRLSLNDFFNEGRLEVRADGELEIESNGGDRLGGTITVASGGVLRVNREGPGNAQFRFDRMGNWDEDGGVLSGGALVLHNAAELRLRGSATTLRNETNLQFIDDARIVTDAGRIRSFDNRRLLAFSGGGEQIVALDNAAGASATFILGPNRFQEVQSLRNRGLLQFVGGSGAQLRVAELQADGAPGQPHTYGWRDGRLAGGQWFIGSGSSVRIAGSFGPVQVLAARITLDGPGAALIDVASGGSALASLREIESGGALRLKQGADFTATDSGPFVNRGTLEVGGQTAFTAPAGFEQRAGTLIVDGALNVSTIDWIGGRLSGTGVINGSMFVSGDIGPPPPPGPAPRGAEALDDAPVPLLAITGSLVLADTAVFEVNLPAGGVAPPVLRLDVAGGVTLGGTLRVDFSEAAPFLDPARLSFVELLGGVSGDFASVQFVGTDGKVEAVSYGFFVDDASGLTIGFLDITPVPEPGTWALWLAGLVAVVRLARRRGGAVRIEELA